MLFREDKMKLIIITQENIIENEAEAINLLFDEGLSILHLRKPDYSETEIERFINNINPQYREKIVLHDHFQLAKKFELKGVHLNRRNPNPPIHSKLSISKSCHNFDDVKQSAKYSYVFLSPIFDSISKQGYNQAFSNEKLIEAKDIGIINNNVIALGGISIETIPIAARYGFGGVAVLGSLWGNFAKDKDYISLINRFKQLQNICNQQ